jgi:hypothetical protein
VTIAGRGAAASADGCRAPVAEMNAELIASRAPVRMLLAGLVVPETLT